MSATHGRLSLRDHYDPHFVPGILTNLTILSVKKPRANALWHDTFTFGAGDLSMLRSGFTVSSITSTPASQCPRSFHEAMKAPFKGEWTAALLPQYWHIWTSITPSCQCNNTSSCTGSQTCP